MKYQNYMKTVNKIKVAWNMIYLVQVCSLLLCSYVCIFHIPYHSECNVNIELYYADDLTPAKHNRDWHRVTEPIVYIIRIHNSYNGASDH